MVNTKVETVIVNSTQHELVIRVGNQNCFAKLATIVVGGEHKLETDINWTYQEFALEPANADHVLKKITLNSDDCCDYERMTVTESGGKLHADKVARGQINADPRAVTSVVANWRSYFTWPSTWPKFHWKFWIYSR